MTNLLAASPRISNQKSENNIKPVSQDNESKKDDLKKLKLMHNESYPTTVYAVTENLFESGGAGALGEISPKRSPTNKHKNEKVSFTKNGKSFDDVQKMAEMAVIRSIGTTNMSP